MMTLLTRYEETEEPTLVSVSPYLETEEPTSEVHFARADAIYEAHERMRCGNHEAAGVWFLMASGLEHED